MFSSLLEAARNSPFSAPTKVVKCEESSENNQLVSTRNIQAAAGNPGEACEFGSLHYFALCGVGGILSCGSTHTFVVPLDLVKCRLQVNQAKYKNLFNGFRLTVSFTLKKFEWKKSIKYLRLLRKALVDWPRDGLQHCSDIQLK
jgi:solute carrier family 25 phosphate transporter 3